MNGDCQGRCCYLNHVAHADGSCCRHEQVRARFSIPCYLKRSAVKRSQQLGMSLSDWLRLQLETFGELVEMEPRESKLERIDVQIPKYLNRWIEARDGSRYVSRRLAAMLSHEKGTDCDC